MRVYIGPYRSWVGPYQLARVLKYFGFDDDQQFKAGEWLSGTWLNDVCQWIHDRKKRKIKIKLHPYDTWNLDSTLALLIAPLLRQLKETKHGAGSVDDEDVPENLRRSAAKPLENDWDTDEFFFDRFDYVLDEMIWAFEQLNPEVDGEAQFYSGFEEFVFERDQEHPNYTTVVHGPRHTMKIDHEGLEAYHRRIRNGTRLFGKYYQSLWD